MKKKFSVILLVALFACAIYFFTHKEENVTSKHKWTPISIEEAVEIKGKNFVGSKPVILGSARVAASARKYVNESIKEFEANAKSGTSSGSSDPKSFLPLPYSIDMNAKYVQSFTTESIVINQYLYTGGANGNDFYRVFTGSIASDKVLLIKNVIDEKYHENFVEFVKNRLFNYRPAGSNDVVIFEDSVNALTIDSFSNWSMDNQYLVLYFDKYTVAPGALGSIVFPIPLSDVQSMMKIVR